MELNQKVKWEFDDEDIKLIQNGLDLIKEGLYTNGDKKLIPRIEENKQKFKEYQERCNLTKEFREAFYGWKKCPKCNSENITSYSCVDCGIGLR